MKILIKTNGKESRIHVKKCSGIGKFFGLMFKSRKKAKAILFEFRKPVKISIHSLFVFFPFLVVWIDKKEKIIDFKIVQPFNFRIKAPRHFVRLIEVPLNNKHFKIIKKIENAVDNERFKY